MESHFWFHQSLPLALVGCNNAIIGIPRQRSSKLWPIKCFHQWGWEWPLFCGGTLPDLANQILQLWLQKKGKLLPSFPSNDASLKPFRILIGHFQFYRYIHDSRLLDSDGRVHVVTQMVSSVDDGDGGTALSLLSINNAELSDRGNYTCKPASGGQASISLHVLEGNKIIHWSKKIIFTLNICKWIYMFLMLNEQPWIYL